jgi:hypothetical protein
MLNKTHGGKFQITSYPKGVGYSSHTSCVPDSSEERDKYATFLVFLNEMGADGGGETVFPGGLFISDTLFFSRLFFLVFFIFFLFKSWESM